MLKKIQLYSEYHTQAANLSFNLFCRKPLATLMTIAVIAIALSLPTLFLVFTDNLSRLTSTWQQGARISLYLKLALPKTEMDTVIQKIQSNRGVKQATLIPPDQGLLELTRQEGMQDLMNYLPENPLPAVIEVVPDLSIHSPAQVDLLSRQLSAIPGVVQAKVDMEWLNRLHTILRVGTKMAHALMILLALAVCFIIGNTLRLSVHNRHEEIQVLKLIGAQDSFILRPFLYSGVFYGLTGAIFAVFLVNIFILSLGLAVNQLVIVYQMNFSPSGLSMRQILILLSFSSIIGWLGARLSVKRQLASIEP